jgi:hypothetical protein
MKICPGESKLFSVDGRTDGHTDRHDEANSRFAKFCEKFLLHIFKNQKMHKV